MDKNKPGNKYDTKGHTTTLKIKTDEKYGPRKTDATLDYLKG